MLSRPQEIGSSLCDIVADCTDSRNLVAAFSLAEKIACEQNHNVAVNFSRFLEVIHNA